MHSKTMQSILLIVLAIIIYFFIDNYVRTLTQERYHENAVSIRHKLETLIHAKQEAVSYISMALAKDSLLKTALSEKDHTLLDLQRFAAHLKENTPLQDIWFQVIDTKGKSFYRSWTERRSDNMLDARMDIAQMLQHPKIMSTISTGKYDMTFKTMVPIYDSGEFIGIFESIADFDSIAEKIDNSGWQSVILVDKRYYDQLIHAPKERFIDDYLLSSSKAGREIVTDIKDKGVGHFIHTEDEYLIDQEHELLIVRYLLNDLAGDPMGHFLLFRPLVNIDLSSVIHSKYNLYLFSLLSLAMLYLLIRHLLMRRKNIETEEFNIRLRSEVAKSTQVIQDKSRFLQNIIDSVSDSVMVINTDYTIAMMNSVAKEMWDESYIEDIRRPKCYELSHHLDAPCDGREHPCPLISVMETKQNDTVTHRHYSSTGEEVYVELTAIPMTDEYGDVVSIIEIGHDVTSHMQMLNSLEKQKESLSHQANHDTLTQLPNRLLFLERLRQTIGYCERSGQRAAVVFIDLDDFKTFNDSLGHNAGDIILQETANRLQQCLRTSDTVARLGGDEFTMIINIYDNDDELKHVIERVLQLLSEPIKIKEKEHFLTASIGISFYPDHGSTPKELLENADKAMYATKDTGRNNYSFYTSAPKDQ